MSPHVRTGSAPTPWKHLNLLLTRSSGISHAPVSLFLRAPSILDSRNFDQGGYRIPDNGTMFRTDCKLISRSILRGRALHWYEVTELALSNFNGSTPGHAEISSWRNVLALSLSLPLPLSLVANFPPVQNSLVCFRQWYDFRLSYIFLSSVEYILKEKTNSSIKSGYTKEIQGGKLM